MAGLAPRYGSVAALLRHAILELSLVRVGMATRAIEIAPVIDHRRLGLELRRFLMAVTAGNGDMSAGQHESGLFMSRQPECGRLISVHRVAAIAGIQIRCGRKLPRVLIGVAVGAAIELDFE